VAVRLLLTLGVLLLATLGAGTLVTGVHRGSEVEQVDAAVVEWLAAQRTGMLDDLSGPAAELGNTGVVIGLGLFVAVLTVVLLRRWWPAVLLAVLLVGELFVFLTTTAVIDRPRPPVVHLDEVLPPTSSFPSGHTSAAVCLYGGIAVLVLAVTRSWWRWLAVGLAALLIVTVALARLYRGAHYPTDVLGSLLFAVPWLVVTLRLLAPSADRRIRAGDAPDTQPNP
jgi:undecaprenyl-diphosphatase